MLTPQPLMHPRHHAGRDSHDLALATPARFVTTEFYHAGFIAEHPTSGIAGHVPQLGNLLRSGVPFHRDLKIVDCQLFIGGITAGLHESSTSNLSMS